MQYKEFMTKIDEQVLKTLNCNGHKAFKEDIERLKRVNTGFGLSAIAANVWLKEVCYLSDEKLLAYVEYYKKGQLNAWAIYK